jgi:hypothetical protein
VKRRIEKRKKEYQARKVKWEIEKRMKEYQD